MDLKLSAGNVGADAPQNGLKAYETPRLESYGDATAIAKSLDIHKIDEVDIAAQGSVPPP